MGRSKTQAWIAVTVVLAVLVLGGGWFLVVSPQLSEAQAALDETAQVDAQNEALRVRNSDLKKEFDQLPALQAEIASMRDGVPVAAEYAPLIRQIEEAATAAGVTVTDLLMTAPTRVDTSPAGIASPQPTAAEAEAEESAAPAEAAAAVTAADGAEGGDASTDEEVAPEVEPAESTEPLLPGLNALPLTVTVQGPYANARVFVENVQTRMDRLVLVTGFSATGLLEGPQESGLPAKAPGDVSLSLSGMAFVLTDSSVVPPQTDSLLPAGTGVNPFLSVRGTAPTNTSGDDGD